MNLRKLLPVFLLAALVAALSAYVTQRVMTGSARSPEPGARPSYEVLNERLGLTEAQRVAVREIGRKFEARECALRLRLDTANRALAETITEEGAYTPKVAAAVEHVHMCMGELQKESIAHLFELSGQLDEGQRRKLMQYAALALDSCPDK